MRTKPYVIISSGGKRRIERHSSEPTFETRTRPEDVCAIGPFRTVRGASFMRDYGRGNTHCCCVQDAEQLAAIYAKR